jgi:hypothetical protein
LWGFAERTFCTAIGFLMLGGRAADQIGQRKVFVAALV